MFKGLFKKVVVLIGFCSVFVDVEWVVKGFMRAFLELTSAQGVPVAPTAYDFLTIDSFCTVLNPTRHMKHYTTP